MPKTPMPEPGREVIRAVIFDLDDTLYDCLGQRLMAAHRYAAEAMVKAGVPATVAEVLRVRLEAMGHDSRLEYIDAEVCRRFGLQTPQIVTSAARAAFFSMPVGELTLFPGALEALRDLAAHGVRIFVVTFGDPETQRQKIRALGLDREPSISCIYYADTLHMNTKTHAFRSVLEQTGIAAVHTLVVGDHPGREIGAGKRLGMKTVRVRGGEFERLEAACPEEQADYEIRSVRELLQLPLAFG